MWPLSVSVEDAVSFLHSVPAPHWVVLSVIFLSAGVGPMGVGAVHDFAAYRLQHLDLHGVHYGRGAFTTRGGCVACYHMQPSTCKQ